MGSISPRRVNKGVPSTEHFRDNIAHNTSTLMISRIQQYRHRQRQREEPVGQRADVRPLCAAFSVLTLRVYTRTVDACRLFRLAAWPLPK